MPADECTEVKVTFAEIDGKFDQIMQSVESVKEKQDEMAADISKIKEAVYNPDSGLYARLRALESWKDTSSRVIWILVTSMLGLMAATIYKTLF